MEDDERKYYKMVATLGEQTKRADGLLVVPLFEDETKERPEPYPTTSLPDTIFEIEIKYGGIWNYCNDLENFVIDSTQNVAFPRSITIQNIGGCWIPAANIMKLLADGHMARAFYARHKYTHPDLPPPPENEFPLLLLCFGKTKEQEKANQLQLEREKVRNNLKRKIDELETMKLQKKRRRMEMSEEKVERKSELDRVMWLPTKLTNMTRQGDNDATITALNALDPARRVKVLHELEKLIHEQEMQMDEQDHGEYESRLNDEKTAIRTMFCQWTEIDMTKTEAATCLSQWFQQQNYEYYVDGTNTTVPTPTDCEAFIDVGFVKLKHSRSPYTHALAFQKINL